MTEKTQNPPKKRSWAWMKRLKGAPVQAGVVAICLSEANNAWNKLALERPESTPVRAVSTEIPGTPVVVRLSSISDAWNKLALSLPVEDKPSGEQDYAKIGTSSRHF